MKAGQDPIHCPLGWRAETIGSDNFLPTADVSTLGTGESGSYGAAVEVEVLPQNGVLWNLDRIVCAQPRPMPEHARRLPLFSLA